MDQTLTPPTSAEPSPAPGGDAPPTDTAAAEAAGRRRWRHVVAVVAVLGAAGGAAWWWSSDAAADDVVVRWSDDGTCRGAPAAQPPRNEEVGVSDIQPGFTAAPGMRCVVTVEVHNRSGRPVTLHHADAGFAGLGTGSVVSVDPRRLSDERVTPTGPFREDVTGVDARIRLADQVVEPGSATTFDIPLAFNADGCNAGGIFGVDGWPTVTFSAIGRSFTRAAADDFSYSTRGQLGRCR